MSYYSKTFLRDFNMILEDGVPTPSHNYGKFLRNSILKMYRFVVWTRRRRSLKEKTQPQPATFPCVSCFYHNIYARSSQDGKQQHKDVDPHCERVLDTSIGIPRSVCCLITYGIRKRINHRCGWWYIMLLRVMLCRILIGSFVVSCQSEEWDDRVKTDLSSGYSFVNVL